MAEILTKTEMIVAKCYERGLIDKEVAEYTNKPLWTIKTHKKNIYQKLKISTSHELILYLVCLKLGKSFNLQEIRNKGLSAIFSLLLFYIGCTDIHRDTNILRPVRSNVSGRMLRGRCRKDNCFIYDDW